MFNQMKTKAEKVAHVLASHPETRESDNLLINAYWRIFDGCERLNDMLKATPPEAIIRVRRKLNEQGSYLPMDSEVRKRRRINEETVRQGISKVRAS